MRRFVVLAILLGLMTLLQALQAGSDAPFNPLSLATFGFVLLGAYTLGQVAASVQLPKITGYIVTGLVFGPQIFNIFSSAVEADLRVVNDLAIGLIALSAGAEMQLSGLKRIARSLLWIVLLKGTLILVSVVAVVFALASFVPFLAGQSPALVLSVGMILGVLAIGTSPAATIAVISETGAKGRLADTTLGVAVAKDIVMVVLLAVGVALARTFSAGGHGFEIGILGELALDLALSLAAGGILGAVIIAYIRYVGAELWLFVIGIIFAMTAIAHEFHLEALLVFIVAGFVVRNASSLGHDFLHLVEKVALPVYVVFFSVAGAGLDLSSLGSFLLVALAIVVTRLVAIYVGTAAATRLAGEPEPIRRYVWLSFVSQAGVVIGLSIIVENNLPGLGSEIRTLVMGTVAIHLLLGPVLFKMALTRAGEVRGVDATDEEPKPDALEEVEEVPLGTLPEDLASPIAALERTVEAGLQELAATASAYPLRVASELRGWPADEAVDPEGALEEEWARHFTIAVHRFWSAIHRAALDAPRQISVPLEERWFRRGKWDSTAERWIKRHRRLRRALKRLSGAEPVLHRSVPVRSLALYHLDNALAEDLETALARIAAEPALTLRDGLRAHHAPGVGGEAGAPSDAGAAVPDPLELLGPVVASRFKKLRRELLSIGTAELRAGRRRPSSLHDRSRRARKRTEEAIAAWDGLARAVVEHERRRVAVDGLRADLKADADRFSQELAGRFDDLIVQPVRRAGEIVSQGIERVEALRNADAKTVEEALLEVSESLSLGLRRQALAGLRRSVERRPLEGLLRRFDDGIEDRLESLPEEFEVVDPSELPDPERPPRSYPETTSYEFRLIATGAVERTLRPALAHLRERAASATERAAGHVQEVRELLELRLDAAVDAAMEEGREESPGARRRTRESLHVASTALDAARATLAEALEGLETDRRETVEALAGDFAALLERIESQLASARPLEARLQAERARVELQGTVALRLFSRRLRRRLRDFLVRIGLRDETSRRGKKERARREPPPTLQPAGRAGSDRAVLFHILFDHTTLAGKVFDGALILTILASILVLMLESVEPIRLEHGTSLGVMEWLFTLLFTLEYAARLWSVDRPARYAFSFFGLIDLLAVVPTYLSLLVPGGQYLMVVRVLRVARAFRVLKLARYVGEAQLLLDAMRASRYKITVFLVYVVSAAVVVGSAMYLIEGADAGFTSIPRSVYWSIVTLTTVGFGDITPQTTLGQSLAALLMILGYGIIAVPTGIVTAEIATRPERGRPVQACPKCGHVEDDPAASYCLVCGASLVPK